MLENPVLQMTERRSEDRWNQFHGCRVAIDGRLARLQDLSPHGARLECPASFPAESVVRLDLPWGVPVRANVLSSDAGLVRLRFDYEIEAVAE